MNKRIAIIISIMLYALFTYGSYSYFSGGAGVSTEHYEAPTDAAGNIIVDETQPKTEECPINGEMLTKGHRARWEKRRPLVVMIENSLDARPQSGLTSADVVYEAVAEGGITRFAAVYYCKDADFVGPVRSARVYFVDFASEYGSYPLYAHVGGANCNRTTGSGCANGAPADALGKIQKLNWQAYNDMNHIAFPVMWRDYDRLPGRVTEHTVYSSTKKLWDYAAKSRGLTHIDKEGEKWDSTFTSWKFKDGKAATSATAPTISFNFWEGKSDYSVEWTYDPASNTYKRVNGSAPHLDKNNDKQIQAHNVAIAFMVESEARDNYDAGTHMLYKTTGTGEAIVFQDGGAVTGTWKKEKQDSRIRFFDKSGKEVEFNRGQVFIEIVPKGNTVEY